MFWKRYIDPRNWFKVKVVGLIQWTQKVLVKPYKKTVKNNYVFDNKYICNISDLIYLN